MTDSKTENKQQQDNEKHSKKQKKHHTKHHRTSQSVGVLTCSTLPRSLPVVDMVKSLTAKELRDGWRQCGFCAIQQMRMHKCGMCMGMHYCSNACQRDDWSAHRGEECWYARRLSKQLQHSRRAVRKSTGGRYDFDVVMETLAGAAAATDAAANTEEGHIGQQWAVRKIGVIVRQTEDLDGDEIRFIGPEDPVVITQRGPTVTLPCGIVRMPIEPEGWVTLHAHAIGGPTLLFRTTTV